jgi:hypothetical protein
MVYCLPVSVAWRKALGSGRILRASNSYSRLRSSRSACIRHNFSPRRWKWGHAELSCLERHQGTQTCSCPLLRLSIRGRPAVASLDAALLVLMELANAAGRWWMMANLKNDQLATDRITPTMTLAHRRMEYYISFTNHARSTVLPPDHLCYPFFFVRCGFTLARTVSESYSSIKLTT